MSFWVLAAIELGTLILGQLLKPKVKRPKAPDLEGWFAEEARPIPIIYGTQQVSPNIVWWGDGDPQDSTDGSGTYYLANMIGTVCLGQVEEWVDIQFGGKSVRLEPLTKAQSSSGLDNVTVPAFPFVRSGDTPATVALHARQMFGGKDREGGVEGEVRCHFGTGSQAVDVLTTHSVVAEAVTDGTARPGVCYLAFGTVATPFYWGRLPNPREVTVVVRTKPAALLALGLAAGYTDAAIGFDVNPMEILYDLLTSATRGAGVSPALLDTQSMADAAATLQAEQFGLSLTVASQDEVKDLLDEVCRHIDGVLFQDLETGLLAFRLVRADYVVGALPSLTVSTATDFRRTEPNWRGLLNEVRVTYRRWSGGTFGTVTTESLGLLQLQIVVTPSFTTLVGRTQYQCTGRNITNVTLVAGVTTLTPLTDYTYNAASGIIAIFPTATVLGLDGSAFTITFSSAPTAMRLVEAVAAEYDLADQTVTGEVRSATLDFPYVTRELTAQTLAARQRRALGLPVDKGSCRVNRTGHGLAPGDAVRITYAPWGWTDHVLRITNIPDGGTLEDGRITLEWVDDVWGEDALPSVPAGGGGANLGQRTAPPMAALYCSGTADQLVLQASDPTFEIELQRADDTSGTGAVTISPVLVGTTTTYTDGTAGKTHRARQVRDGWTDGSWTAWLDACAVTTVPSCTLPTVIDSPVVDVATGTLAVDIDDPQLRVQSVAFRVRTADGVLGDWTTDSATPYEATVTLVDGLIAYITRRVQYYDCDAILVTAEATYPFVVAVDVPDDGDPPIGITVLDVPVTLQTGGVPVAMRDFPAAATELTAFRGHEDYPPMGQYGGVYIQAVVSHTDAPVGAFLAIQGEDPVAGTWDYLDGVDGPHLALDVASLDALDAFGAARTPPCWNVKGEAVLLRDEITTDARIRAVIVGGDDASDVVVPVIRVRFISAAVNLPPIDQTPPPPDNPGTPLPPTGLVIWLDTAHGLSQSGGNATGTWIDQVAPETNPTFSGSVAIVANEFGTTPALSFAGAGEKFEFAAASHTSPARTGGHLFLLLKVADATPPSVAASGLGILGQSGAAIHYPYTDGHVYNDYGSAVRKDAGSAPAGLDQWHIAEFISMAGEWTYRTTPVLTGITTQHYTTATNTVVFPGSGMRIGPTNGAAWYVGKLAAWIEYDSKQTTALTDIRQYLLDLAGGTVDGGTGLGDGDGSGGPGTDPIPDPPTGGWPPPPVGGVRPFAAYSIPAAGLAYWNCAVKIATPSSVAGLIAQARAAGGYLYLFMQGQETWLDAAGRFSYTRWQTAFDQILNHATGGPALDAGIADGTVAGHFVIDEPYVKSTRYGGTIPIATVERMCSYSKTQLPTLKTFVSVNPIPQSWWLTRHVAGLDYCQCEYMLIYGDCQAYKDDNIARAAALGHGVIMGPHYANFNAVRSGRAVTPAELRHYGRILCSPLTAGYMGWKYTSAMVAQAGFYDALKAVRDYYASLDP